LPVELLEKIDEAMRENKQINYSTREEFVKLAIAEALKTYAARKARTKMTM
jgi:metal-responsive CopG/Arc/MetJ family transcriptional regulator